MRELGPEARRLVEAAREADGPTEADRRRVRRGLTATLAAGAAGTAAPGVSTAAAGAGAATKTAVVAKKLLVAVAATGMVGGGAAITRVWEPTSEPRDPSATVADTTEEPTTSPPEARASQRDGERKVASVPAPSPEEAATEAGSDDEPARDPSPEEAATEWGSDDGPARGASPSPREAPPAAPVPAEPIGSPSVPSEDETMSEPPSGPGLAEELALLRKAHGALRAGDGAAALAAVEAHVNQFPEGALRTEVEAALVLALCALGRTGEASRAGRRFLEATPESPLAGKVRASCASVDTAAGDAPGED